MENVRHVGLIVSNIEEALKFYRDLLGLKIKGKMQDERDEDEDYLSSLLGLKNTKFKAVKLAPDDNKTRIELIEFSNPVPTPNPKTRLFYQGYTHVGFTVNDLDEMYLRLKGAGVHFNSPPKISKTGTLKVAFCKDFEGNYLELTEEI